MAEGIGTELQALTRSLNESVDECVVEQRPITGRRLAAIRRVGRRMHELTEQLQSFVGQRRPSGEHVDLSELVLELSERLESEIGVGAAHLGFDLPVDVPRVRADAAHLRRIVSVLVRNAVDAGGDSAAVRTLACEASAAMLAEYQSSEPLAPGLYAGIEVRDTGCGMDEATRAQVLEPFFSTKSSGRGLALAEVLGLVGACQGGIRVKSAPGTGTTVTVLLPAAAPEQGEGRGGRRRAR
jgi:signal transduction histidine kinase